MAIVKVDIMVLACRHMLLSVMLVLRFMDVFENIALVRHVSSSFLVFSFDDSLRKDRSL